MKLSADILLWHGCDNINCFHANGLKNRYNTFPGRVYVFNILTEPAVMYTRLKCLVLV